MPDFFEQVDSMGIVENHIHQVLGLETSQEKLILQKYTEIRRDLVDRLSRVPNGTFTSQRLHGVLAQVEGAITAMSEHLEGSMVKGAYEAALKGVEHLTKEMAVFDSYFLGAVTPINLNAAILANDTAQLLVTRYKTNLDGYGVDLQRQIVNGLFSATIGETNYEEVVGRIGAFFNAEEWKLRRIVRTELHGVYNRGKLVGMQKLLDEDTIPELKKTLIHPMDARTGDDSRYAASKELIAEVSEPFKYTWQGKPRIFQAPPDRPNDRAIMVPYNPAWVD